MDIQTDSNHQKNMMIVLKSTIYFLKIKSFIYLFIC